MAQLKKTSIKPKASSPKKLHPPYILLVEDESAHAAVIRHAIRSANPNATVNVAGSLQEYRSAIAISLPDIVLIDINLPDGKAFDVLIFPPEAGSFPIVVMTGHGDEKIAVKAMKAGALDYVVKSTEAFKAMPHTLERVLREWKLIQERKRAEEALRESEEIFRHFMEHSPISVFFKDENNRTIRLSKNYETMLGKPMAELLGKNMDDLFPSELAKSMIADDIRIMNESKEVTVEEELNGRYYSTIKFPIFIEGKPRYLAGYTIDITERKHAEEELRDSEQKFRTIFDHADDGMLIVDLTTRKYVLCNAMCSKMLGFTKEEFVHLDFPDIHPPENLPFIYEQIGRFAQGEEGVRNEIRFKRRDGTMFFADVSPALITLAGRRSIYLAFRDVTERKLAEEVSKQTEENFRRSLEDSPLGVRIVTAQGDTVYANRAILDIYGYDNLEELKRTPIKDRYTPESYAEFKIRKEKRERGKFSPSGYEISIVRKNGEVRYVQAFRKEVFWNGAIQFQVIYQDITERKRAEELLRDSEEKYKTLFAGAREAIIIADSESGILLDCNESACSLIERPKEELIGKHQSILHPPDELVGDFSDSFRRHISNEQGHVLNARVVTKSGVFKDVEIKANVLDFRGKNVVQGFFSDITERKRTEEALQESELRFRSLYENTTIGLYRTTPAGKILLANPALVKMLGYTSFQKLAERNLEEDGFEPSYQRKEFIEKIERDGEVNGLDAKWIRQDGTVIFVLESARAIRDSHGKTLYYDGTVEDITERKLLEEELRQMQKLEGLGTLAGGIAHDFNNILGIILAYNSSIERFKGDTEKLDLATDTITKAVQRGKTLVQQILTFARKTETKFGAVNVNDVVVEIMTMILETFSKILTYAQNFEKEIPFINADRSQLHQALLNLCVNARDAMPTGGVLTINTRMVSGLSLRNQHPDAAPSGYVCIEVSDTGEGMTPETRKRIFEPFFTTRGIGKGTGLGLAVVFGVVQTHKGFIDVESELGKGTTFRLYLPVSEVAEPISVKDEETLEEIPGGTEMLLVVEDEEMLMASLQMVLVEKGYKVLSAEDGLTALKIYQERENDIALVLTDLGLPNMTGLEVCQRIKKINPNERMILATGYLDPEMKSEFLKAGIQHFLFKPYDLKQVLKVVREVLDGK